MAKIVDRDAVAADWSDRGFSCALWVDPPGQVWEVRPRSRRGVVAADPDPVVRIADPLPLESDVYDFDAASKTEATPSKPNRR